MISLSIKFVISCVLLTTLLVASCESKRILGFFPTPSKSHLIIHSAIVEALAENGHDITLVTTIPWKPKSPKIHHIQLKTVPKFSVDVFAQAAENPLPWYKRLTQFIEMMTDYAQNSLQDPDMQKLMKEESFDVVILGYFTNDFLLGVGAHFKCPIVLSFQVRPVGQVNDLLGNPQEISYVPSLMGGGIQPLGFVDRIKNFIFVGFVEGVVLNNLIDWFQADKYNQNFPADKYPSFEDMKKNISLVLTNHHFSQGPIRPNVPALVEIGGIQIKNKPDPLPEDIRSILGNATEHGAIYFSLGSNVQGNTLDSNKVKAIFNVLSKLPQTVLWKWGDSDYPGESPNIFFKSWLPQDDILPHPNVKLFITHGGQGSVVESSFHGVPMVGIPLFADQSSNMENVVKQGFGLTVEYADLTEESLSKSLNEVLTNNKYRDSVQKFSNLYKDRPMTAKETAVFWMEYVLRHHGAPHMQSPAVDLNSLQLMSLDVIGFLLACIYIVFKINKIIFLFVKSKVLKKKSKVE